MTPRDDERRKFEAWMRKQADEFLRTLPINIVVASMGEIFAFSLPAILAQFGDRVIAARAEQAETPRVADVNLKRFDLHYGESCDTTDENGCSAEMEESATGEWIRYADIMAAAPVEDRPAPTPEDK